MYSVYIYNLWLIARARKWNSMEEEEFSPCVRWRALGALDFETCVVRMTKYGRLSWQLNASPLKSKCWLLIGTLTFKKFSSKVHRLLFYINYKLKARSVLSCGWHAAVRLTELFNIDTKSLERVVLIIK